MLSFLAGTVQAVSQMAAIREIVANLENVQIMVISPSRSRHPMCRYDTGISRPWGLPGNVGAGLAAPGAQPTAFALPGFVLSAKWAIMVGESRRRADHMGSRVLNLPVRETQ
jgi:hypothetical protein